MSNGQVFETSSILQSLLEETAKALWQKICIGNLLNSIYCLKEMVPQGS
jgi:hypothetical protein